MGKGGRIACIFTPMVLTIASLVTYLNAAMPPDKHEDFDTGEVTKAAMALQSRGQFVLEGDVLRIKS